MRLAAPEEHPAAVADTSLLEQPSTCSLSRRQCLDRPSAEQRKLHSGYDDPGAEIDTDRDAIDRCLETIECALPLDVEPSSFHDQPVVGRFDLDRVVERSHG